MTDLPPTAAPPQATSKEDWDATRYDRISDPQVEWGRRVIARLGPQADERILDLGCGTARLTSELATLVPGGLVIGFDRSEAMLGVASTIVQPSGLASSARVQFVRGEGTSLPFASTLDAVFSTATLHWIADHDAAFRTVMTALSPGGRFVSQCGGGENLLRLYTRAAHLMRSDRFEQFFAGWRDPLHFAFPEETRGALDRAGFVDVRVWLESTPAVLSRCRRICRVHQLRVPPPPSRAVTAGASRRVCRAPDAAGG